MRTLKIWSLMALVGLLAFTGTSLAADAIEQTVTPAADGSLLDLLKPVYSAFSGGHYAYAGALVVILLVALTKRYLGKIAWLHSDAGGSTLALVLSTATAMAAGLATPGAAVTWALMKTALLVGVGAAGGFAMIKNLIVEPFLVPLMAKAPAWLQPILGLVTWIFEGGAAKQAAILATAAAAGSAAVAAAPGGGVAAVTGTPTDVK